MAAKTIPSSIPKHLGFCHLPEEIRQNARRRSDGKSLLRAQPAQKEDQFSAGGLAAGRENPPEEATFGSSLEDYEDSNPTKGREGRSLADYYDPPFVSTAHPPEEIGDIDGLGSAAWVQIHPPRMVEGFPSSETFFYLRLQDAGNNIGGGLFASLSGGQLSNTTTTPLFILMLTLCGILYLLIKKCGCFMKCGWKQPFPQRLCHWKPRHGVILD